MKNTMKSIFAAMVALLASAAPGGSKRSLSLKKILVYGNKLY